MFEKIMEASTGVYILWGIGVLGIFLKILANAYMSAMVRASGKLGDTKRKKLRNMFRKYENKKEFGLCGGDEEAYAEKFVRSLRFLTQPMEFWNRSGTVLSLVVCGTMAGAYIYYGNTWRGSPDMQFFLANSIIVCACLLVLDHILLIKNKVEILKANILVQLERIPKPQTEKTVRQYVERVDIGEKKPHSQVDDNVVRMDGAATVPTPEAQMEKESAAGEETLNRFLAEFFP